MIQMTWPGAPTLYYGDEAGVCGWTDPDSRRTYPWGKEDLELIEFHRYMTGIHRKIPVFRKGAVKPLLAGYQKIAYGRMYGKYQPWRSYPTVRTARLWTFRYGSWALPTTWC